LLPFVTFCEFLQARQKVTKGNNVPFVTFG
jgi:hypothetical protein